MSTHLNRLPNRKRLDAIVLGASLTLLVPTVSLAAPPQSTQPDVMPSTRSITEARNARAILQGTTGTTADAAMTTSGLTAQQGLAMQQQLESLDTQLDDLLSRVNTPTGTQRDRTLATVVQALASQVSAMRQALLASGFSSFDRQADGQTIFIPPSNTVAEDRRQPGLESTTIAAAKVAAKVPTIANTAQPSVPPSSMSLQAQSRRSGGW